MEKNVIKNAKFTMVDSVIPKYAEILVSFKNNNVMSHRYYFIAIKKGLNNADYIKEAKLRFNNDVKSNKIKEDKENKKRKPLLIAFFSFLGVATLTFAGLYTYKMLVPGSVTPEPQPQPDPPVPPVPSDIAEVKLDEDTAKDVSVEPAKAPLNEVYHGKIKLKSANKCLIPSSFSISMRDGDKEKELEVYRDYNITPTGKKDGVYTYNLDIEVAIVGDFTIHAPVDDFSKFMINNQTEYEGALSYFEEISRLKVNGNGSVGGLDGCQCATYDGNKAHSYNYGIGFAQDYYTEITGDGEYSFDTWANEGTSKYWAYYPSDIPLYDRPTLNEKPMTIENDSCLGMLLSFAPFITWGDVVDSFDYDSLSYNIKDYTIEYIGDISFDFSFYNGHFTRAYMEMTFSGINILLDVNFVYEFPDDVVLPDPENVTYYDASDTVFEINKEDEWQEALTFSAPNLYFYERNAASLGADSVHIYDGSKYIHFNGDARTTDLYDTNGTNYYRYSYDQDDGVWSKDECSEGEYHAGGSFESFVELMDSIKDNASNFNYRTAGNYGYYEGTVDDVPYELVFEKVTTKGKTPETLVLLNKIDAIYDSDTIYEFHPIAKYADTYIELPIVE